MNNNKIKLTVKEKYSEIAKQAGTSNSNGCCGSSGCCGELEFSMIGNEYDTVKGHNANADLGLGCGLPTEYANLQPGQSVLDLGAGAGNDCFVARTIIGDSGMVTGIDFSSDMVKKARENASNMQFENMHFVEGDIEEMPFQNATFDVVLSNCVLNLVPDKHKAFAEIMRVLKPGGHFCVSDVVIKGELPKKIQSDAELFVGCVSGALNMEAYVGIIEKKGFRNIETHKLQPIMLPDNILKKHLTPKEMNQFATGETGIFSITISATKD
ncbi:MAG: arsenite methyltransferase [Salinivirgaceae bacterium]